MNYKKSKSLLNIESKMEGLEEDSFRYKVLNSAKSFKSSWIELGQGLYSVYKDKMYREWGYSGFDIYCQKELGIKKETSLKLLRSYYFIEREEPQLLKDGNDKTPAEIPNYEAVNVLRLAKNRKTLQDEDYKNLRESVFEKAKDAKDVRREFRSMLEALKENDPVEERDKRRRNYISRLITNLKSIKKEIGLAKLLPSGVLGEIEKIINKLEIELK